MEDYPAIVVHGLDDALTALSPGLPVTLLSAPGAGLYAGCLWWRHMVARARASRPGVTAADILDCADGSGQALAALRSGVTRLVLWPSAPDWAAIAAVAAEQGGIVLPRPPPALDLADPQAARRVDVWVRLRSRTDDIGRALG